MKNVRIQKFNIEIIAFEVSFEKKTVVIYRIPT